MTKVNAIVCAYWPERFQNIQTIVEDLKASTRPPDNIFILNNNPEKPLDDIEGVYIINSSYNFRCRGKYIFGLMEVADYYLYLDDDTSVNPQTIERCLEYAHFGCCFAYLGAWLSPTGSFGAGGTRVWPHDVDVEVKCELFCGPGVFVSFSAVAKMVAAETYVRDSEKWAHEGDDILLGLINSPSVIPMDDQSKFKDLSWHGVSMLNNELPGGGSAYYDMRDEFITHLKARLSQLHQAIREQIGGESDVSQS